MLAIVRSLDQWRPELKSITKKIQIFINYKAAYKTTSAVG
jgi:hypothetical protein